MDKLPIELVPKIFDQLVCWTHQPEEMYEPDMDAESVSALLALRLVGKTFAAESYGHLALVIKKKPLRLDRAHLGQLDAVSQRTELVRHIDSLTFSASAPTKDSLGVFRRAMRGGPLGNTLDAHAAEQLFSTNLHDDESFRSSIGGAQHHLNFIVHRLTSLVAVHIQQAKTLRRAIREAADSQQMQVSVPESVMTMSFSGATAAQRMVARRIVRNTLLNEFHHPHNFQEVKLENDAAKLLCVVLRASYRTISFLSLPNFDFRNRMLNSPVKNGICGLTIPAVTTLKLGIHDSHDIGPRGDFPFKVPDLLHTLPHLSSLRLTMGSWVTTNTQHILLKSLVTLRQRPLPSLRSFTIAVEVPETPQGQAGDFTLVKFLKAHRNTLRHFGWDPCGTTPWCDIRETLHEIGRRLNGSLDTIYLQDPYYPPDPEYPSQYDCFEWSHMNAKDWNKMAKKVFIRRYSPQEEVKTWGYGAAVEDCPPRFPLAL